MKKTALPFLASVIVASSAIAGQPMMTESKHYKEPLPELCFADQEFQLDLFGSYTDSRNIHGDGFGGGIALNFFFHRNIGFGVDGNIFEGDANGVWDTSGRLIVRFPIDEACIAPYIFGGGGIMTDSTTVGTWHAGGGLEYRATQTIGIFGEGRYTWGANNQDAAQARLGVRFVF